jgi:hypothetical protein
MDARIPLPLFLCCHLPLPLLLLLLRLSSLLRRSQIRMDGYVSSAPMPPLRRIRNLPRFNLRCMANRLLRDSLSNGRACQHRLMLQLLHSLPPFPIVQPTILGVR